jgi:hypothetical protein
MTNDAQASANRRNAEKSTGPRTEAGKARSSMNALRHGSYVQVCSPVVATLLGEEPDGIDQLHEELVRDLDPQSPVELMQAIGIAQQLINLHRAHRLAAPLVDGAENSEEENAKFESTCEVFQFWDLLRDIVARQKEPALDDVPYEIVAHALYDMAPDRTAITAPQVAEFPGNKATPEAWRAEVIRLVEATIGPLEEATRAINVRLCELDDAVQREGRRSSGIEARRLLQTLDDVTALTDRVDRGITRSLKNYWAMREDSTDVAPL